MPSRVKPGNWSSGDKLLRTELNQLQTNLTYCGDLTDDIHIYGTGHFESTALWQLDATSRIIVNDDVVFTSAENLDFDGYLKGKTKPIDFDSYILEVKSGEYIIDTIGANNIIITGILIGDVDIVLDLNLQALQNIICNFTSNGFQCNIFPNYYDTYRIKIYPGQNIKVISNTVAASGSGYYNQPIGDYNTINSPTYSLISTSSLSGGIGGGYTDITTGLGGLAGGGLCSSAPDNSLSDWATTGKWTIDLVTNSSSDVIGLLNGKYTNGIIFTNNKAGDRYEFTIKGDLRSPVSYTTLQAYPYFAYLNNISTDENNNVTSLGNTLVGGSDSGNLYMFPLIQETARAIKPQQEVNGWFFSNYNYPILRFGMMVEWIIGATTSQFPVQIFGPFQFTVKQYRRLQQ